MFQNSMPRISVMPSTLLDQDYHHALWISLLRGLAALQVAAAHLRAQLFPGLKHLEDPTVWYQVLAFFTGFAHQGVVVFFLLSGWLVGGSLLNKLHAPHAFALYAIDRVTRLWIVLIPAFVLTLAIGAMTGEIDPAVPSFALQNPYSVAAFVGNLFGLQDMLVPRFGGNFPLWSLANEIWYYVLFPLMVLPFSAKTRLRRTAALAAFLLAGVCLSGPIMLYLPLWLLGVGASRIRIDALRWQRAVMLAALLALSVYFRLTGSNDKLDASSFFQDMVFGVAFLLMLASLQFRADRSHRLVRLADRAGARMAAFSFTLYVVHVPLLVLLRHLYAPLVGADLSPHHLADFGVYLLMLVCIVLLSYVFHLPFEAQTGRVRAHIKQMLSARFQRRWYAAGKDKLKSHV